MREILNKIKLRIRRCEAHEQATTVVFISDLKEIVSELEELEKLQDAIANLSTQIEFSGDPNSYYFEGVYRGTDVGRDKIIYNAIQESNNRRKNNEQL
jgi:hypothetical protein